MFHAQQKTYYTTMAAVCVLGLQRKRQLRKRQRVVGRVYSLSERYR